VTATQTWSPLQARLAAHVPSPQDCACHTHRQCIETVREDHNAFARLVRTELFFDGATRRALPASQWLEDFIAKKPVNAPPAGRISAGRGQPNGHRVHLIRGAFEAHVARGAQNGYENNDD
jgi:hypothetical protein